MLRVILSFSYYHWVLGVVATLPLLWIYRLTAHPLAKFPGPKLAAISSFYYAYYIYIGRLPEELERLFTVYKTNVIRISPSQIVFRTPQSLKDVVGRHHDVYRGNFALRILGFTSDTVSNIVDPNEHRRKRKLMNPGFSATTLAKQEPILIRPLVSKLVKAVAATGGEPMNVCNYFDCVTSDIIGKLSFGADFHMMDEPNTHEFLHVLPRVLKLSVIAQSVPEVFQLLNFIYVHAPKFFTPKPFRAVADFAGRNLRERERREANGEMEDQHDIMSVIMADAESVQDEPRKMTRSEITGEATVLIAGGGDTVATALSGTMWNLTTHPTILKELQKQARDAFDDPDAINSKTVAAKLPLVDAVLQETMRMKPVLPGPMWRRTAKSIVVDGYVVPIDTEVGVARYSLFRNEAQVHDPDEFIPQRWMQDMGDNLEGCQAFGAGPKTCIGRYLAMVEMRLIVTNLLWHFDWELLTKEFDNPEYVVQHRKPLWFKATPRVDNK